MNADGQRPDWVRGMALAVVAMIAIVAASNYLVQFPINEWLTWGAITYPASFFVTDLANRAYGPSRARQIVYAGFVFGVAVSAYLATWRIAAASGTAFLVGQLLDIFVFNRLRQKTWWQAPFIGSAAGSVIDTWLFFGLAFAGTMVPWVSLAWGDLWVKLAMAVLFLAPFRALMNSIMPVQPQRG